MLGLSSIFLLNFFPMYFATRPRAFCITNSNAASWSSLFKVIHIPNLAQIQSLAHKELKISTDARLVLTKSPRVQKCVHYIWSLRLIKNCPHICNLSIFCPLGKAAWAARSVDSGHNFYYPFTYTFAIIILFNVPHPKKIKSWRQKEMNLICKKISLSHNLILQRI